MPRAERPKRRAADALNPQMKLAVARRLAKKRFPFYGDSFVKMVPVWLDPGSTETVGILPNFVTLIDPTALDRWSTEESEGVLCHEVQHPLRDHAGRGEKIGAEHDLWNIACDAEINDDLVAAGCKLPDGGGVTPQKLGLPPGGTAEWYYQELKRRAAACPKCGGKSSAADGQGNQSGPGDGDGEGEDGEQSAQDPPGASKGRDRPDGQGAGQKAARGRQGSKAGRPGACGCPRCNAPTKPVAGGGWDGSGGGRALPVEADIAPKIEQLGRTPAEVRAVRRQVAESVREAVARGRGDVPAGLARWAEEFLKPPKVDWRQKLGEVCRTAVKYRPGATDYSYSRPSRRQGAYGFGIGRPILPDMVQPVPHVAIAVDTSGSMSHRDLGEAVSEADGVLKAIGAPAAFLACDAKVGAVRPVRTRREVLALLVGGGGTDFRPVFDEVAKLRPRPEVLVFATDGQGPAPAKPLPGVKTIWLLIGKGSRKPYFPERPWGEFIEIGEIERDA